MVARRKQTRLGTMRFWVRSLTSLSELRTSVAVSCGVGRRRGSDPMLLWLWRRPVAIALIQPLVWELPYAMGAALKSKTKKGLVVCIHLLSDSPKYLGMLITPL